MALSGWQIRSGGGTVPGMTTSPNPCRGFRFPAEVIEHAVWLYHCFSLSLRDVELILAARGIVVSYESIREWGLRFGRLFANTLKRRRPKPGNKWHLDEVFIRIRPGTRQEPATFADQPGVAATTGIQQAGEVSRSMNGFDQSNIIPLSLAVDLLDVGVVAQRAEAFWREPVPGGAAGVDDGVVIVEQPVRKEALAQIQPDALDRVQLGRVRWQRHQRDVAGDLQRTGAVPSGLVQHHHGVLVSPALGGEALQEQAHRLGRDLRQHERGALAGCGLDGGEDVCPMDLQ